MKDKNRIAINGPENLLDIMSDMWEDFILSMASIEDENDFVRSPESEEDVLLAETDWLWTPKAERLIEEYHRRLKGVFERNFPEDTFNIHSHFYRSL